MNSKTNILFPVHYDQIQEHLHSHTDAFRQLLQSVTKDNSSLNFADYALAYFSISFTKGFYATTGCAQAFDMLLKSGDNDHLIAEADGVLAMNPLHCTALSHAWIAATRSGKPESLQQHYGVRLLNTLTAIALTGDGSEQSPFFVTSADDEYEFMQQYLDLWDYTDHELIRNETHICDKITLKQLSDHYTRYEIYFDISRGLQVEQDLEEMRKEQEAAKATGREHKPS